MSKSENAGEEKISKRAAAKSPGTSLAVSSLTAGTALAIDFSKVKVVREVAVPQLSIKGNNVQVAIRITSPITAGNSDKDTGKPVFSCKVIDLTDGIEKSLVMPAIPRSELTRTYPNDAYVGKDFALMKQDQVAGKRYNAWKIVEIDTSGALALNQPAE